MTAFDYPKTAATAKRLLTRFGAACAVKHPTGSTYDPATGSVVPTYDSTSSIAAVLAYPQKYIDGTLILQGDSRAFCAPDVAVM